jgi:acetyl-CoA synthetase
MPLDPGAKTAALAKRIGDARPRATIATSAAAKRLGRGGSRTRIAIGRKVAGWLDAEASAPFAAGRPTRMSADVALDAPSHSHASIFAQGWVGEFWLDLRRTDLHGAIASVADPLGLSVALFAPWMIGCAVAWPGEGAIADWLARYPISTLAAPAAAYAELVERKKPAETAHLRHCVATEPTAVATAHAWQRATSLPIHAGWGRPECPVLAAHLRGLPVRPGSIGRPFPGHEVLVVDGRGRELAPHEDGELALRGRPPTLAAEAQTDGDLHRTGARAMRDEQGYLWLRNTLA